jgi:hypothetical protein
MFRSVLCPFEGPMMAVVPAARRGRCCAARTTPPRGCSPAQVLEPRGEFHGCHRHEWRGSASSQVRRARARRDGAARSCSMPPPRRVRALTSRLSHHRRGAAGSARPQRAFTIETPADSLRRRLPTRAAAPDRPRSPRKDVSARKVAGPEYGAPARRRPALGHAREREASPRRSRSARATAANRPRRSSSSRTPWR